MVKNIHYRHIDNMILLRNCTLFSDLAPSELQRLVLLAREHHFGFNETVITKGMKLNSLYIVKQGSCSLGEAIFKEGEAVLEEGLFVQSFTLNDALIAETEVVLVSISKEDLYNLLRNNPTTSIHLVEQFAQRLMEK